MQHEMIEPRDYQGDPMQAEGMDGLQAASEQAADGADWDFWDSEYWIVRDQPPYRV